MGFVMRHAIVVDKPAISYTRVLKVCLFEFSNSFVGVFGDGVERDVSDAVRCDRFMSEAERTLLDAAYRNHSARIDESLRTCWLLGSCFSGLHSTLRSRDR